MEYVATVGAAAIINDIPVAGRIIMNLIVSNLQDVVSDYCLRFDAESELVAPLKTVTDALASLESSSGAELASGLKAALCTF